MQFVQLCFSFHRAQQEGSLGWPQAEIAHSALLYEVSDSIGIRSEFPARARLLDAERGKEAVGADPPWKIASEAGLDSRTLLTPRTHTD